MVNCKVCQWRLHDQQSMRFVQTSDGIHTISAFAENVVYVNEGHLPVFIGVGEWVAVESELFSD